MVKFNTICRAGPDYERDTKFDIQKVHRNSDPSLHPLQKAREYQRAMVSAKIDKIYSQPFLGVMTGHSDGISQLATSHSNLQKLVSGSYDGEIRVWDVPSRKTLVSINAHKLAVKGVCFNYDGMRVLTSGDDKSINLYDFPDMLKNNKNNFQDPLTRYLSKYTLGNIDHHYSENQFTTSGQIVQVWNYERTKPFQQFQWGPDTILSVKYCPSDCNILAGTSMDRCLILYDIRAESPIHKVALLNKSQCLAWNPIEPINVTIGNDDSNCYTFDIRKMDQAKVIHKDHIQAVMAISYSPTGQEFVTGSFDKTIRIFPIQTGLSREIYHAERMQQVNAIAFSQDAQWIFSGSNDMNIRLWKSKASQKIGVINKREENVINYRQALQNKFKYNSEIKKIIKHRHIPKYILNAKNRTFNKKESKVRKLKNIEINNKAEFVKPKPERQQKIQQFKE